VRQQQNTKDTHSVIFTNRERERGRRRRDKNSDHHLDEKREEEEDFIVIARFILPASKSQKHNNNRIFSFQKSLRVTVCLILSYEEGPRRGI